MPTRLCGVRFVDKTPPQNGPIDLGLRIGTKKEAWLEKLRKAIDEERENCEYTAELNRAFVAIIEEKIKQEKETFK